jgi:predicted GTPase
MTKHKIIIIGAAGRDFHNFNTFYRDNDSYEVVAFTAAQIPDIAGRKYPAELAGALYPSGIPICDEKDLATLIVKHNIDECVFSYSDVPYQHVMSVASIVNTAGAAFSMLGSKSTKLKSSKPVIAILAARTGCGKSQTSRAIMRTLKEMGLRPIALRHPMPYGDIAAQKVQRFASVADLDKHKCTIEEREEYEPHVVVGNIIYAGVDYQAIIEAAENDPTGCDIIIWDGGNNDMAFLHADITFVVTDPHRPGHELSYYPSEINMRQADVVIINKIDSADFANIQTLRTNIERINPKAQVVDGVSILSTKKPEIIKGKRVLVIEDGPTLTHGEMKIGAGTVAAIRFGAKEIVDARSAAVGKLKDTYATYPNIGKVLPAMGYGEQQIKDLAATINKVDCDAVVVGTPIDLEELFRARGLKIDKPTTRVLYELQDIGKPDLKGILGDFAKKHVKK